MIKFWYDKRKYRYRSRIYVNNKAHNSPSYKTKQEAIDWYNNKSLELLGFIKDAKPPLYKEIR
jgi:hypothetical protein